MGQSSDFEQGLKFFYDNDYANAARCFIKAAEQGDAEAQFCLGNMYAEGHGVPRDEQQSTSWFRRAAEQGFTPAQVNLGVMYTQGQGVEPDLVEAHKWFNIAGGAVNEEGMDLREVVEEQMTPAEISKAMRLAKDWITTYHRCH